MLFWSSILELDSIETLPILLRIVILKSHKELWVLSLKTLLQMGKQLLKLKNIEVLIFISILSTTISFAQIQPIMVADQSKLILWLSPDSGALNSLGNPATINQDIFKWNDLSGRGWVFENRTSARRPNLALDGGNKYLDFVPGDFLEFAGIKDSINGLTEFTLVVVIKSDNSDTDNGIMDGEVADLSDDILTMRYDKVGNLTSRSKVIKAGISTNLAGNQVESSANIQTTNRQILVLTYKRNNKLKLYINGDLDQISSANVTTALSGVTKFLIGKGSKDNATTSGWDGKIGEILLYKKEFSADTIASVKGALATIKSITTGGWNNTSTWDCNCIPPSTALVQISTGTTVSLQSGITAKQITIKAGGTLDVTTNNYGISLKESLYNYGTLLTRAGTFSFTGTAVQNIYGNNAFYKMTCSTPAGVKVITGNQTLKSVMTITSGSFTTNDALTILSTATETGSIASLTGVRFYGNVTMQRYHQTAVNGWLNLASPVTFQTLQTWNDDIITTGFIGSQYPDYPFVNIRSYTESALGLKDVGFNDVTNITNTIPNGQGYWAYIAAGTFTIDATGPLLIGNFPYVITYNSTGSVIDDGWNLLANPYPSAIDWDNAAGWTKSNLNNAIYVWDATIQQYTSYISGVGINGGTRFIPSSQSFWIQTNASSPALTIKETAKTSTNGIYKSNHATGNTFSLKLAGNIYSDELAIMINEDATFEFDGAFDAYKFEGGTIAPKLSSITPLGTELAINSIPLLSETIEIPIKAIVPSNGDYKIITSGISQFTESSCITLEDTQTGIVYDLRDGNNDTITINLSSSTIDSRFTLHLSKPIQTISIGASCAGLSDGSIMATALGSGPYTFSWKNESEEEIFSNTTENSTSTLENLPTGFYTVTIGNSDEICTTNTAMVYVEEPTMMEVNNIALNPSCEQINNGSLALQVVGGTEPYEIDWADGNTGILCENLSAGMYMVSVSDANGCTDIETINLVNEFNVQAAFDAPIEMDINNNLPTYFENNSADATEFTWNFGDGSETSNEENPTHFYANTGTFIVTLTAKNGSCDHQISHTIVVTNSSVGANSLVLQNELLITNNTDNIYLATNFSTSRDIKITIVNSLGQVVTTKIIYKVAKDNIVTTIPNTSGVYLFNIYDLKSKENFTKRIIR